MIEVKHIHKSFLNGKEMKEILKDISLKIEDNSFTMIVGPSGSGKTTLLYTLSGLESVDSGAIYLDSVCMTALNPKEKSNLLKNDIGFVFQFFNLIPNLTVKDNLRLAYLLGDHTTLTVEKALEMVGMLDYIHYYPDQLSGGMQQRVSIARSLLGNRKYIFADEPTGNLDMASSYQIMDLFKMLNETLGITIIMVTHNPDLLKYATNTIKLVDGKVI